MRSVIWGGTSIHLVYVMIPGKGIANIPGKEITMYWVTYISCKRIMLHRLLRGNDDDTSESGIDNALSRNNHD